MKNFVFFVIGAFILATLPAEAGRVNKRQASQRARIHQGVKSGELTKREAHKLNQQQRGIRRQERRAKADGTVTDEEAAKLEKRQDRASKAIYRNKHDAQDRGEAPEAPSAE
jgi:hypothetical protein